MTRALRILSLIENATEPRKPEEPDPAGDKYRRGQQDSYGSKPRKAKKSCMLDGSYQEEPGFYIGCPKCGQVGSNPTEPKGDITDTLCKHCEEPLVLMGSVEPKNPPDKKVVQAGKLRAQLAAKKRQKEKKNVKSKSTSRKTK